jgi:cyclohexa-1,5-dienecarbonyl-CoA hydratase
MPPLVAVAPIDDGAWRVTFGRAPGNILDADTMDALSGVFRDAAGAPSLRAICLEGAGGEFSFGASVHEHRADSVATMLRRFHDLLRALLDSEVATIAVVRGRCLGGGLELAALCHRIVASAGATFGQPEIALGVFAPVGSLMLRDRIGRGAAEDLCLTGRSIDVDEACAIGLVDERVDGDPMDAALDSVQRHLASKSASTLRIAVRAGRLRLRERFDTELPAIEGLYLDDLMSTEDAHEGLAAFLEKRPPRWRHR